MSQQPKGLIYQQKGRIDLALQGFQSGQFETLLRYSPLERVAFQSVPRIAGSCGLLSYSPLECVAFPQITQIAACCTLGMRRISRMRTFGAVAAYPKRALFQRL
jgi:hypothetical protein